MPSWRSHFDPVGDGCHPCRAATARRGPRGPYSRSSTGSRSDPVRRAHRPCTGAPNGSPSSPGRPHAARSGVPRGREVDGEPACTRRRRLVGFVAARRQRAAEVTDRGGPDLVGPILRGDEVGHRRPGVERLRERAHRRAGMAPTQGALVLTQPDLEALGRDAPQPVEHPLPLRSLGREAPARGPGRRRWHRQHHQVEVLATAQVACPSLRHRGRAGEAGQSLHRPKRRRSGGQVPRDGLPHDKGVDGRPIGRRYELLHALEQLDLDTASQERLVERHEDDVAHPGSHLPEDGALVVEPELGREEGAPACRELWTRWVTVLMGEDEVVLTPHDGRLQRGRLGAVPSQPCAEVEVVDGVVRHRDRRAARPPPCLR